MALVHELEDRLVKLGQSAKGESSDRGESAANSELDAAIRYRVALEPVFDAKLTGDTCAAEPMNEAKGEIRFRYTSGSANKGNLPKHAIRALEFLEKLCKF